jgi:hypothetical protein
VDGEEPVDFLHDGDHSRAFIAVSTKPARRTPERDVVLVPQSCPRSPCGMAGRLKFQRWLNQLWGHFITPENSSAGWPSFGGTSQKDSFHLIAG